MMNARLEELRSKFQENPRRYFAPFANELRKSGDLPQAISVCRTHLASQPGHVSGHIVLGQALYEAGESAEARGIFTAALELDPENLIALRTLGEIAQVNGEFTAARQWYERLLDADPRNTEVSQLLRDIPTAAAPAAAIAPLPDVEDIPRPDQREEEKVVEPPPAPRFHTTFSGSGPAYKSATDDESASDDRTQESAEPVTAGAEMSVESPAEIEPVTIDASAEPDGAIELVDVDEFHAELPPEPQEQVPDEAYEAIEIPSADDYAESGAEADGLAAATAEFEDEFHIPGPPYAEHVAEQVTDAEPEAEPESEPDEPVRAFFAERGFDGPAGDQVGWMTTPSAALSDLEAAPEDWYDESSATQAEESPEAAAEPSVEAPQPVEASAPDPTVDSWFDHVEGAATIEATEVTTDEFWLPPELPTSIQAPAAAPEPEPDFVAPAAATEPEPEFVAEMPAQESAEEADFLSEEPEVSPMASSGPPAAEEIGYREPESFEDESFTSVSAEAESAPPVEEAPPSSWAEPLVPPFMESYAETEDLPIEDRTETEVDYATEVPTDSTAQVSMGSVAEEPIQAAAEGWTEPAGENLPEPALMGHTPAFIDAVPPTPPAPFVTETLAELYLQQGFRDEALAIYRQLAERDPSDETLKDRIAAIEKPVVVEEPPAPVAQTWSDPSSQSVRTFFSRLARRPAVPVTAASSPPVSDPSLDASPDVPFANAASALANLFAASKPSASDEGAASSLASAFTDPAGKPSRAADGELSLDHLFRDVPPAEQSGGGVSLDEFFAAPGASPGSPTDPGEAGGPGDQGGTDIRQFTAWLEGLRKK